MKCQLQGEHVGHIDRYVVPVLTRDFWVGGLRIGGRDKHAGHLVRILGLRGSWDRKLGN